QVDPHALVAVEHAGAIVPPAEAPAGGLDGPVEVAEAPVAQSRERVALGRRDMRAAVGPGRVPYILVGRRDVEIPADDERFLRVDALLEPGAQSREPAQL